MNILSDILSNDETEIPLEDENSLLYGDETVIKVIENIHENKNEKFLKYFMFKASSQQFLEDSYEKKQWNTSIQIKQKIRNILLFSEVYGIVVINGSRHFHGYFIVENDNEEFSMLGEEEAKLKPLQIRWIKLCHIPYYRTTHIINSLKGNIPLKYSLNGDEIDAVGGQQIIELIHEEPLETIESQRNKINSTEAFLTERFSEQFELPFIEEDVLNHQNENSNSDNNNNNNNHSSNNNSANNNYNNQNHSNNNNNNYHNNNNSKGNIEKLHDTELLQENHQSGVEHSTHSSTNENGFKRRGRSRSRSIDSRDSKVKIRSEVGTSYLDMMDIVNMTYEEYLEAYRLIQMRAYDEHMMNLHQQQQQHMGMPPPGMGGMIPPHMPQYPPEAGYYGQPPINMPHMMGSGGRGGYRGGRGY